MCVCVCVCGVCVWNVFHVYVCRPLDTPRSLKISAERLERTRPLRGKERMSHLARQRQFGPTQMLDRSLAVRNYARLPLDQNPLPANRIIQNLSVIVVSRLCACPCCVCLCANPLECIRVCRTEKSIHRIHRMNMCYSSYPRRSWK